VSRVQNKVVFITGAGQGQGRSHAVRLATEGADIIATDCCAPVHDRVRYPLADEQDLAETKKLVEKTGRRCVTAIADVRDRAQVRAAVELGVAELGKLDVVVANAGIITFHERSWEIPEDVYDAVVDTNQKGVWNTIVSTVPELMKSGHGGSIIITSSAAGIRGQALFAHYTASKHAVVGMMRAFANELAPHRIRVNTIHPSAVSSPGMGSSGAEGGDAGALFMANPTAVLNAVNTLPDLDTPPGTPYVPLGSLQESEVSHAVLFLASEEARYITGVMLPVDAGNTTKP
jgi:SDR family mycofactocin-dependent oxidoreductase